MEILEAINHPNTEIKFTRFDVLQTPYKKLKIKRRKRLRDINYKLRINKLMEADFSYSCNASMSSVYVPKSLLSKLNVLVINDFDVAKITIGDITLKNHVKFRISRKIKKKIKNTSKSKLKQFKIKL